MAFPKRIAGAVQPPSRLISDGATFPSQIAGASMPARLADGIGTSFPGVNGGATIDLLAELGDDLFYWYEVPAADSPLISLADGNRMISLASPLAGKPLIEVNLGHAPSRMVYSATGGPNGQPCVSRSPTIQQATRGLATVADGTFVAFYGVCGFVAGATGGDGVAWVDNPGDSYPLDLYRDATNMYLDGQVSGGSYQEEDLGAVDLDWHVPSVVYTPEGVDARFDNVPVDPPFTGTGGCDSVTSVIISGGKFAFTCVVLNPTPAKDRIVRAYLAQPTKYRL